MECGTILEAKMSTKEIPSRHKNPSVIVRFTYGAKKG